MGGAGERRVAQPGEERSPVSAGRGLRSAEPGPLTGGNPAADDATVCTVGPPFPHTRSTFAPLPAPALSCAPPRRSPLPGPRVALPTPASRRSGGLGSCFCEVSTLC